MNLSVVMSSIVVRILLLKLILPTIVHVIASPELFPCVMPLYVAPGYHNLDETHVWGSLCSPDLFFVIKLYK